MIQVLKKKIISFFLIFFIVLTAPHKLSASYISTKSDEAVFTLDDVSIFSLITFSEMAKLSPKNFCATIYLEVSNTKEGFDLVKTMVRRTPKGKRGKRRSLFYDIIQKMHRGIITIEREYRKCDDISDVCSEIYLKRHLPQLNAYKNRLDLFRTGNITFKRTKGRQEEDQ